MVKNYRAILHSNIRSLPVQRGRIMVRPENIQKFVVTDLRRIEFHFNNLSVSGPIGADIFIPWILFCSPCVPNRSGQHALQIAKSFFHSPETACAECGFLRLHTKMMMRLSARRNHAVLFSAKSAGSMQAWGIAPRNRLESTVSAEGAIHDVHDTRFQR